MKRDNDFSITFPVFLDRYFDFDPNKQYAIPIITDRERLKTTESDFVLLADEFNPKVYNLWYKHKWDQALAFEWINISKLSTEKMLDQHFIKQLNADLKAHEGRHIYRWIDGK